MAPLLRHIVTAHAVFATALWLYIATPLAQGAPPAIQQQSDISGLWLNDTATPLARPPAFADQAFFTEEEAREYEKNYLIDRVRAIGRATGSDAEFELKVNGDIQEPGHVLPNRRTSLIVDPPNGQVPALTAEARARAAALADRRKNHFADGPEDRPLPERCLLLGAGPPMMPVQYNNHVHIFQTDEYVAILNEMMHDVRLIPLDGRPHLLSSIRQWKGDSRGHWEDGSLIVDTTNFTNKTSFNGSGPGLHLVERFKRVNDTTLQYEFTVDDPGTFTRPWSAVSSMRATPGPMYEYACHEGNYSLVNVLKGARLSETGR